MNPHPAVRHGVRPLATRVWGNSLARPVDRMEAGLVWLFAMVWLLALPLIATIGSVARADLQARADAERESLVAVEAVLTGDARFELTTYSDTPTGTQAQVSWLGRDGQAATGLVAVPPSARAGDGVTLWLDRTGRVVDEPVSAAGSAVLVLVAGAGGWIILGLLLLGIWWVLRRRLDRRRWQEWAQEWEAAGRGGSAR